MGNKGSSANLDVSEEDKQKALGMDVTVRSFAARLAAAPPHSVVVCAGAGISVSAGIPDFRTPGSGLYDNLQKYDLPTPESIFTLDFFRENPMPFYQLAREMYPGNFKPTPTHAFIRLLQEKGKLLRCFTQNINTLEREAGVDPERLVEAHGSFGGAHCIDCDCSFTSEWVKTQIYSDNIPVLCTACKRGLVKPDIVFFGEGLPRRFFSCEREDMKRAELVIVMGTSLTVQPFAGIFQKVQDSTARLLVNRECVGLQQFGDNGFIFDSFDNYRDVALLANCDDGVRALCHSLGGSWSSDLEVLVDKICAPAARLGNKDPPEDLSKKLNRSWRPELVLPPMAALYSSRPEGELGQPWMSLAQAPAGGDDEEKTLSLAERSVLNLKLQLPAGALHTDFKVLALPIGANRWDRAVAKAKLSEYEKGSLVGVTLKLPSLQSIENFGQTRLELWLVESLATGDILMAVRVRIGPIQLLKGEGGDNDSDEESNEDEGNHHMSAEGMAALMARLEMGASSRDNSND